MENNTALATIAPTGGVVLSEKAVGYANAARSESTWRSYRATA